ncbi:MAG: hypothetical protein BGN88_08340 [Clostridiales bacterium 43-6]|nr:MAG: hypothetical protein BGN88_08340 [Clostridiales bacterium 43-6]
MHIIVIDGQGGGLGKAIVEKLRCEFHDSVSITALGTNALAASIMIKAGANEGASGENAIVVNAKKADFIIGATGIISANSMLGELSPKMARAISESNAVKILIPLNRCNIQVAGIKQQALPSYLDDAIELLKGLLTQ